MSLTTRLSIFFLAALAVVLIGFSATLYFVAERYLQQQVDERLASALDVLDAAVDRETDGLDWDALEKRVSLGQDSELGAVRWQVTGGAKRLDSSPNLRETDLGTKWTNEDSQPATGVLAIEIAGRPWQVAWRRVSADYVAAKGNKVRPPRHASLLLTAALSLEPAHATLRKLLLALAGLSGGVLLLGAIVGRWVCRRALAPVRRMAAAAGAMGAPDLGRRLPGSGTTDELGELHRAFNSLLDRLQEAFERQRRFTGDASHQLRTPLTAMLGQVEVALRRERPAEDYRHVLTLVHVQADHLRRIVEALLFLARADADADLANLETIDLAAWLPKHLEGWKNHPRANDLQLVIDGSVTLRAHEVLLGQLVDNLLDNACKYSEPGTPVKIEVKGKTGTVALAVEDSGLGIGPEDLPHIFEAFYRSAEARRQGKAGVGLGLAMARRIATALRGTLNAESELGRGSRFRFCALA